MRLSRRGANGLDRPRPVRRRRRLLVSEGILKAG